ncbi:MAG: TGS domain-containing protein [Bdellovibrionota bacterium]
MNDGEQQLASVGDPDLGAAATAALTIRSESECFSFWMRTLSFVRPSPSNRDLLSAYFLERFSASAELFYQLLVELDAYLDNFLDGALTELELKRIAQNYLEVLSPLAERFGIFREKNRLDSRCFQILHPAEFLEVDGLLSGYKEQSEKYVNRVSDILQDLLMRNGFDVEIYGRYKTPYSVFRKLKKRASARIALHDVFAFRVVVSSDDRSRCYDILNLLHDSFYPVADRFKDYISIPKINGYESLHTCLRHVLPELDLLIEVQIRTRTMHEYAKNGLASHWLYARTKRAQILSPAQQRLLAHFRAFAQEVAAKRLVYCFSYTGDVFALPASSTLHDFARGLHSELGETAVSGQVNGEPATLDRIIEEGDRIRIIADPSLRRLSGRSGGLGASTRRKVFANAR